MSISGPKCLFPSMMPEESFGEFVDHYNDSRLHSVIGLVTPRRKLEGQESRIFVERDRKLAAARENRRKQHTRILEPEVGGSLPLAVGLVLTGMAKGTVSRSRQRPKGLALTLSQPCYLTMADRYGRLHAGTFKPTLE